MKGRRREEKGRNREEREIIGKRREAQGREKPKDTFGSGVVQRAIALPQPAARDVMLRVTPVGKHETFVTILIGNAKNVFLR